MVSQEDRKSILHQRSEKGRKEEYHQIEEGKNEVVMPFKYKLNNKRPGMDPWK